MSKAHVAIAACLLLPVMGCHGYERRPLVTEDIVARVEAALREPLGNGESAQTENAPGVTLAQAAEWMRQYGPDIREVTAAYRTALARAQVKTPLPNPILEVGPEWGFGPDVDMNRVMPFGSLGITIPLGGRLRRSDDLNRVRAEVARIDGVARHRELYLELRRRFSELAIATQRRNARDRIVQSATRSSESVRRIIEAGQATALDVAFFELEMGRAQIEHLEAVALEDSAKAELSNIVGVHETAFENCAATDLPELPQAPLNRDPLKKLLVDHHSGLARLRARYEEREAQLRLEIARQYPDLRIGPTAPGETGERKTTLGLTLGIDLPVFDRNQQSVTEAEQSREEARVRFEEAAKRALIELDHALHDVRILTRKHRLLKDTILPRARESIELAHRSLAAGSGDALRLLDAERTYRTVLVEVLEAELATRSAWTDLELAVGTPLIFFSSETETDLPRPPAELEEKATGTEDTSP